MPGDIDDDQDAAIALGGLLTSAMTRAHLEGRAWLYLWERNGLRWLIRFRARRPDGRMDSDWTRSFLDLNKDAILSDASPMNFNLRAARIAAESRKV